MVISRFFAFSLKESSGMAVTKTGGGKYQNNPDISAKYQPDPEGTQSVAKGE